MNTRPDPENQSPVYETPWWDFYFDSTVKEDGSRGNYAWMRTHSGQGATMVVPVTPSGRLLLIRVHRYPVQQFMWEFPAGLVDPGEDPETASLRELKEETGVVAISSTYLGAQTPISGLVGDRFHSILAEIPEVELDDLVLQSEEGIVEAKLVSRSEIATMIVNQEIEDGVTLYSLARYWAYLEAEGK